MKSEKKVQDEIIKWLKQNNIYHFKTIISNRKGIPDLICNYKGKFIGIEVKASNKSFKDVTKLQKLELMKINTSNGIGFFTNTLNYVKEVFKLIKL